LSDHTVVQVRLSRHDVGRPFAILRDLGPTLLSLRGAIGVAPETFAAVRGLSGLGPSFYSRIPVNAYDARSVAADVQRKVIEILDAVTEEKPVVIWVEDAERMDSASLELLAEALDGRRRLCVLIASRGPLPQEELISGKTAASHLSLAPLASEAARSVVRELFTEAQRPLNDIFTENAVRVAAGIPLFLNLLFKHYLVTNDPVALPDSLSASLAVRLEQLHEPQKTVFDAIVVLGTQCTERRLDAVTQLPRYALLQALRSLDGQGFLRQVDGIVLPSHDLLALAAQQRMPSSVARLLHRSVAEVLESESALDAAPLDIAIHWEQCGETDRALVVLKQRAAAYTALGRPHEAIDLLKRARDLVSGAGRDGSVDFALFEACCAAGEDHQGLEVAERIGLLEGTGLPEHQIMALEMLLGAGRDPIPFRSCFEAMAADRTLSTVLRARAARLLAVVADELGDADLGRLTLRCIEDIDDTSTENLTPRLIIEAVFGSLDRAMELAKRVHALAICEKNVGKRLQASTTASVAFVRCGSFDEAIACSAEAFRFAERQKIWSACTAFAAITAEMYWVTSRLVEAEVWFGRSLESMRKSGGPDRGFQAMSNAMLFALERGEASKARDILNEAQRLFPRLRHGRIAYGCLAFRLRIELALGNSVEPAEVEELLHGHRMRQSQGLQDMAVDTAAAVLSSLGQHDEAHELASEYVRIHRKERSPIAPAYKHLQQYAFATFPSKV
jgi:tetratricopeptide (TPR) repeat protein